MDMLKLSISVIFHPVDAYTLLKSRRNTLTYYPVLIIFLLVMIVRVASIYIMHFPLATIEPEDTSIWIEMAKMAVPLITWIIACYAITSILGGECFVSEIAMGSAFAMVPYVVFTIPVSIFSLILCTNESALYSTIQTLMIVWTIILFILSVKILNDYSLKQTLGICLLSVFTMFLIWGIIILVFALTSQLWKFVEGIAREVRFKFIQ